MSLTVGMLKGLLENIPDDYDVCVSENVDGVDSLEVMVFDKKIVLK